VLSPLLPLQDTMPIYTVREITGDQKPDPILKTRGLDARVVTMTQLGPLALPDYTQVAYRLYSQLLPAFMVRDVTPLAFDSLQKL
jgi:hypothetical protein